MDVAVGLLQTYAGRDKIMRTVSYATMLIASQSKGNSAQKWGTFCTHVSAARTVGRFFDDLLMWSHTKSYGLGQHERDPVVRVLQLLCNCCNQCYFPLEHIAWFADKQIISAESRRWWTAGISAWGLGLFFGILKSLRMIGKIHHKQAKLIKQHKLESPDKSGEADTAFRQSMQDLARQMSNERLNILKNGSDLMNAVSWLPPGFLWSGKLSQFHNGLFGTISSLIGFYQLLLSQKAKSS